MLGELFIEGDVGSIQAGQIRNQVNILGKAKTVTVKNSTMTLSEVGSTYGSLRILGGGKLRTADEQVTLEDQRVYLGGRQTYDLDQLMNLLQATIDSAPSGEASSIKASQYLLQRAGSQGSGRVSNLYQSPDGRIKRSIPE